ncbi:MAG: hypothetical protein ACEPO0_10710 [Yoonia sp.]
MITNFALSLSSSGLELLHRVPRGWRRVGHVDIASKTLDDDLKALREKALVIEPDGLRTKLVIPLDQIKYIAIDGTLTTEADIHAALEGETPYALEDLVIDSEKFGGRTHVAAVARETLQEAEAFAAGHGFDPVAFVAVPEPFTFQKEVFFGPTDMARQVVGPDALIERDDLPVMIVGTRIKSRLLVMDTGQEAEEEAYKDDLAALLAAEQSSAPDAAQVAKDAAAVDVSPQVIWVDQIPTEYHAPTQPTPLKDPLIPANPVFASPALLDPIIAEHPLIAPKPIMAPLVALSRRGAMTGPKSPPVAPAAHRGLPPAPAQSADAPAPTPLPAAPVAQRIPAPEPTQNRNKPALVAAGIAAGALIIGGLWWSQQGTQELAARPVAQQIETPERTPDTPTTETAVTVAEPVLEVAPTIPDFEIAQLRAQDIDASPTPSFTAEAAADPLAVPTAVIAAPADAPLSPVQEPPAPPAEETAQAAVGAPVLRGQVLSPDEAARIYDATGVWQRAPRFLAVPSGAIPLNFQSPAETAPPVRVTQPDVPLLDGLETDLSFIAPANPPAPDIVFARDENGFILATEDGTVTPEGAVVYAGLPDLAITPRPELTQSDRDRMALLAPAPEGVIVIAGRPDVVPALRPANAQLPDADEGPAGDDAVNAAVAEAATTETAPPLGGVGLSSLELQNSGTIALDTEVVEGGAIIDLRPRLRPQGLTDGIDPGTPDITDILAGIATEDATLRFDNSTALAVPLSLRPDVRPANFGTVVAAARSQQQTQPAAAAAPVTAAAPVAPQNFAPVPGGVARAATQEDAIRLRDINLIGVYGRPNARRALVRLSNGRYVRVEVGSALDGGQVTAIGDDALNYVKRGRTYAIELP